MSSIISPILYYVMQLTLLLAVQLLRFPRVCHMTVLAFFATLLFSLSPLNVTSASGSLPVSSWQKYAHVRQAQRGSKPYYTSVVWWCGVLLMGVGELGNFAAYGFAPASLIAPLGCVSVIGESDLFFFPPLRSYIINALRQKERLLPRRTTGRKNLQC